MDTLPRTAFGSTPEMADALLSLVLAGTKTATCWAAVHGDQGAAVGRRAVVTDGRSRDRAVIETTELAQRRFDEIDGDWAMVEGEDDRTLASWRRIHEDFFRGEGVFASDMPLWCERIRLVEVLALETVQ
jgi:uncharacterized protein YhfF